MSSVSSVNNTQEISPYTTGGRIDPYAIYKLNFEALGGEKNVRYDSNFFFKGEMTMDGQTFEIEEFLRKPLKSLRTISSNFKVLYRLGDDGVNLWSFQDDKLNKFYDGDSPEREIRKLWEEYAYTDPKNKVFTSTGIRKVSVDGTNCYEIKIKNRKTDEVVTHYYDSNTFLLKRELRDSSQDKIQTDFDDYRSVGNILMAFKKDVTYLNTNNKQSIVWDKIDKGLYISDSKFLPPADKNNPDDLSSLLGLGVNFSTYA